MQNKDDLRKLFLGKRLQLTPSEIEKKSRQIAENLFSVDKIRDKENFSIYLPINNEVDTKFIINNLLKKNKNLNCPYFSKTDNAYYFTKFTNWENLEKGTHQILQPIHPEKVDPTIIEIAIIPGIAFDLQGTRLGYGKGVFDTLLAKSKALRIGLAYDFQTADKIPKEKHDLVMNVVITESGVIGAKDFG
ncbi:5-formyltetrahydrofolate cyclo-ligase [Candidatus Curtissbacteria bacterium RIFCSPHIGHO2_02_FULL_40_17]|uniref:5-formyltetrahydrofolate cyclo-ligase n=3 Tax=Candidatus Curtissiibacteriota TaxID=1752717 RepID=A0A1F5GJU4_9BACT|nr:MAG: 5-formyltetrahydrofolate cyclo-ligase [Candidatus Curtissbacteria bacterium RIFCSPHIGHO2_01_FULL_40_12]OGD92095.1 MAG: 5-formyltetrahydrofolate cyclo-ligase [Candidatus Curtissbacteria bacterium RIFCSPHIGHO2_02_FULL_40_17]OGE07988.1 MAG: 5-formyltetrahydrofolate cyclo-ligase [Candidatus Curtissbacteria bacterium RIFCSPLOWO2_02_FULL_40_13b]